MITSSAKYTNILIMTKILMMNLKIWSDFFSSSLNPKPLHSKLKSLIYFVLKLEIKI